MLGRRQNEVGSTHHPQFKPTLWSATQLSSAFQASRDIFVQMAGKDASHFFRSLSCAQLLATTSRGRGGSIPCRPYYRVRYSLSRSNPWPLSTLVSGNRTFAQRPLRMVSCQDGSQRMIRRVLMSSRPPSVPLKAPIQRLHRDVLDFASDQVPLPSPTKIVSLSPFMISPSCWTLFILVVPFLLLGLFFQVH